MLSDAHSRSRCVACPTRHVCLTADLATEELSRLNGVLIPSTPVSKQKHVYYAGADATRYFQVRSGVFKTYSVNTSGEELVTGFYYPGQFIGCARLNRRYTDSAVALETATVCALPTNRISALCEIGIEQTFLGSLAERESEIARHQRNLNQPRADARFAGWLIQVSEQVSRLGWCAIHIPVPMSRTDLASYLGMQLESLSRTSSRFEKAGLINASRNHIELIDRGTIAAMGYHVDV